MSQLKSVEWFYDENTVKYVYEKIMVQMSIITSRFDERVHKYYTSKRYT